jgi:methyltransferase (TIGR00027 family)
VRDETPSRTAAWVAAARQMGQLLPEDVRLVDDPYGAAFASPAAARLLERGRGRLRPLAAMPGMRTWILYMQVRTRVIDDALVAWLGSVRRPAAASFAELGLDPQSPPQLVVLGAGYDCRALRMPELAGARVIEVDHPATQAHKRAVLERLGAPSPATYVTWDFEARPMEDLPDVLAEAGLDLTAPVFTIWEGVTMYLSEPAIDASLRAIRQWSAPGSQLAFTYFARTNITQPSLSTRALKAVVATFGEPWRFGWAPDELPAYLAERGFEIVRDVALAGAARELLPAELAAHVANPDRRFALAAASESVAVAS